MEAIRIKRRIRTSTLKIKELEKLKGRDVEIIILSEPGEIAIEYKVKVNQRKIGGILEKYKNPDLLNLEAEAWSLAVKEKRENC